MTKLKNKTISFAQDNKSPSSANPKLPASNGFHSLEEEVLFLRGLRAGDGTSGSGSGGSAGGSSKHSDSMSDSGCKSSVPYEVLLKDLTQAKRQLLELHQLVSWYILRFLRCIHEKSGTKTIFSFHPSFHVCETKCADSFCPGIQDTFFRAGRLFFWRL